MGAAALTYVAAAASSILQLLRLVILFEEEMTTSKPVNQVNLRNIVLEMLLQVNKGEKVTLH